LGDKFGSTDVDCDCPEASRAARKLLPETGLIFGRQSKPFSHFFYRSDPPVRTVQFIDPLDDSTLVELRGLSCDGSVGLQTVVPQSIHETGEPVRFEQGFEGIPANVDALCFYQQCEGWPPSQSLRATGRQKGRAILPSWLWPACSHPLTGTSKMPNRFTA
jgi:hypothetical protein